RARARQGKEYRAAAAATPDRARSAGGVTPDGAHDHEEHQHKEDHQQDLPGRHLIVGAPAGAQLPVLGVAGQNLDDVVDPAADPAGEVAGLEARQDGILDDQLADRVGERAFEAIADLDPHLTLVGRDDEQRAAVLLLLTDAPVPAELIAIVLD